MRLGRIYFAVQALAGAAWWITVFTIPLVRELTLGGLDPVVVAVLDIPLFVVASAIAALGIRSAAVIATAWTGLVAVGLAIYATITSTGGVGVLAMIAATFGSILALFLVLLGRLPTEWLISGPLGFRPASARSTTARNLAWTLGQIAVFWGAFLGAIPFIVALLERRWVVSLPFPAIAGSFGVVVLVAASALGLWAAWTMSTHGKGTPLPSAMPNLLVIAGPYRWVRNPMALAGILQGVAVGLILSSWMVVAYAIAGALVWNYAIRPGEEANLEERFGVEFRRYRDAVLCWIPRVPRSRAN